MDITKLPKDIDVFTSKEAYALLHCVPFDTVTREQGQAMSQRMPSIGFKKVMGGKSIRWRDGTVSRLWSVRNHKEYGVMHHIRQQRKLTVKFSDGSNRIAENFERKVSYGPTLRERVTHLEQVVAQLQQTVAADRNNATGDVTASNTL